MNGQLRVAINGFGRIGRIVTRIICNERDDMEVVATNDLYITQPDYWSYLMRYDTVHGPFGGTIEPTENGVLVNGKEIKIFGNKSPADCPWGELGVDVVIESSGAFTTMEKANGHLKAGAKKVVITAPSNDAPMFIVGVNEDSYRNEQIVSNASCTTNCLAPLAKIINDKFGVDTGFMTTIHAMTGSQKVVDMAVGKEWRLGRAASGNIIPASTGAAKAVGKVIPTLNGKMTGMAFRVPVLDVSAVDFTCNLKRPATMEEINDEIMRASQNEMKGSVTYTEEPLVSNDLIGESTCTYDSKASMRLSPTFFKLIAWYDNERGYSRKVVELVEFICRNAR